jgi:MoxR-like ATPase
MQALCHEFPERQDRLQLAFLATVNNETFYLYGRTGSGKSFLIRRLLAAFKKVRLLQMGNRTQQLPDNLNDYDIILFQNFNPIDDSTKDNVRNALQDRTNTALILSSDIRPENAMGRAEIADEITLTISMPDSLSPEALCSLLQNQGKLQNFHIPEELAISNEEKLAWKEEIKKVELSEDTLALVGKIAELCTQNGIYVPISKWLALTNMAKAIAFFNGRNKTTFTDTLFLGGPIWGRSTSNNTVMENFNGIVKTVMLKDLANLAENAYDAEGLYRRVKSMMRSSNNLYETKEFNGEPCICYRVTVAGEPAPLYVPLRYIETNEDFNPFNELRQVETHVRCNYHGTSSCTISIDAAVKGIGLRNNMSRNGNAPSKFEDFATLPTYILRENDPEVAKQKKLQLEEIRKEAQSQMEQQAKILRTLRDIYQANKVYRTDLFCDIPLFDKIQGDLRSLFDMVNGIATKLKETLELYK